MEKLNTKHFTKSKDPDEVYNFIAGAVFAMKAIKRGQEEKARSRYGASFLFAFDNKEMDIATFTEEANKLLLPINQ